MGAEMTAPAKFLSEAYSGGGPSFMEYSLAPLLGPPWAAVWVSALALFPPWAARKACTSGWIAPSLTPNLFASHTGAYGIENKLSNYLKNVYIYICIYISYNYSYSYSYSHIFKGKERSIRCVGRNWPFRIDGNSLKNVGTALNIMYSMSKRAS